MVGVTLKAGGVCVCGWVYEGRGGEQADCRQAIQMLVV